MALWMDHYCFILQLTVSLPKSISQKVSGWKHKIPMNLSTPRLATCLQDSLWVWNSKYNLNCCRDGSPLMELWACRLPPHPEKLGCKGRSVLLKWGGQRLLRRNWIWKKAKRCHLSTEKMQNWCVPWLPSKQRLKAWLMDLEPLIHDYSYYCMFSVNEECLYVCIVTIWFWFYQWNSSPGHAFVNSNFKSSFLTIMSPFEGPSLRNVILPLNVNKSFWDL